MIVKQRRSVSPFVFMAFLVVASPFVWFETVAGAEGAEGSPVKISSRPQLFDAGKAGTPVWPLTGMTKVESKKLDHAFKGDAVVLNNRVVMVFRKKGVGVEVFGKASEKMKRRALLTPVGVAPVLLSSWKILQNDRGAVVVSATFATGDKKSLTLKFELKRSSTFVTTEAGEDVKTLRVEAPGRYAVLPDFFADDLVVDPSEIKGTKVELPSENMILQLQGKGEAIVMSVWGVSNNDVVAELSGKGADRRLIATRVPFAKNKKGPRRVWTAVLEDAGIWAARKVTDPEAGKVLPLDWKAPFQAQWRVNFRRQDTFVSSWEMIEEQTDKSFIKYGWLGAKDRKIKEDRKQFNTLKGPYVYPCWIDSKGKGHLQPLIKSKHRFQGPAVIYPIAGATGTPPTAFTVVDIVRNTLGVGPCEYILDVEGQSNSAVQGLATCGARRILQNIYGRNQQKKSRARIEKVLTNVVVFVGFIRDKVNTYHKFGHELETYLSAQKKKQPEAAEYIAKMERYIKVIYERAAARKDRIGTPEYAQKLCDGFRKEMLDYEGKDALKKTQAFAAKLVEIGANQDRLVAESRWAVKVLRQKAATEVGGDEKLAEISREIRKRTQKVLRNPNYHEYSRH